MSVPSIWGVYYEVRLSEVRSQSLVSAKPSRTVSPCRRVDAFTFFHIIKIQDPVSFHRINLMWDPCHMIAINNWQKGRETLACVIQWVCGI
jgi:hypothetical protein